MRFCRALVLFFLTGLILSLPLPAETVHMKFLGHANTDGYPSYPWYFEINGVKTDLICDTFNNTNVKGETWDANVTNILSGQGLFGDKLKHYKAAAIVFSFELFDGANAHDAQEAIWALFDHGVMKTKGWDAGALAIYNAALAAVAKTPLSFYQNYFLYTPIPGTQKCPKDAKSCGTPQEFIGYMPGVPEPSTLVLMGTGILGLAAIIRKKMTRAAARHTPPAPNTARRA